MEYEHNKHKWHSKVSWMSYRDEDRYEGIKQNDIFRAYMHCCHAMLYRKVRKEIQVCDKLNYIINSIQTGKAKKIANVKKYDDTSNTLYVIEPSYNNDDVLFVPVRNGTKLPMTVLPLQQLKYDSSELLNRCIESKQFGRKKWMKELKQQLNVEGK